MTSPPNFSPSVAPRRTDLEQTVSLGFLPGGAGGGDNTDPRAHGVGRGPRAVNCEVLHTRRSFPGERDGVRRRQPEAGAAERGEGGMGSAGSGARGSRQFPAWHPGVLTGSVPLAWPLGRAASRALSSSSSCRPFPGGRGWIGALRARRDGHRRWPLLGDQQRSRLGSWASGATRERGGGRRSGLGTKKAAVRTGVKDRACSGPFSPTPTPPKLQNPDRPVPGWIPPMGLTLRALRSEEKPIL